MTKKFSQLWRCDYETLRPVITSQSVLHPEDDTHGYPLDKLVHFESEGAAWARMESELQKSCKLADENFATKCSQLSRAFKRTEECRHSFVEFTKNKEASDI